MKKAAVFVLFLVLCLSCGCKSGAEPALTDESDAGSVSSEAKTASVPDISVESYSTDPSMLTGNWKIMYFSEDNVSFTEYSNIANVGEMSFYEEGTCILTLKEDDKSVYRYEISKTPGMISFSDPETGKASGYYFGYGAFTSGNVPYLLITRIDIESRETSYYILKKE